MTNYSLEAQIAKEMNELLGKNKETTVETIKPALRDMHLGPRHEAHVMAHAEEWLKFLLKKLEETNVQKKAP